jgi:hypothetical protein
MRRQLLDSLKPCQIPRNRSACVGVVPIKRLGSRHIRGVEITVCRAFFMMTLLASGREYALK